MKRTRKRAIERQRRLRIAKTIDVGDTVEVIENSCSGHDVGTVGVLKSFRKHFLIKSAYVLADQYSRLNGVALIHPISDLKLIKKGRA